MRLYDALIVVAGLLLTFYFWSCDGSFSLRPSFKITIGFDESSIFSRVRPVVTDLRGDGRPQILAVDATGGVGLYDTHVLARAVRSRSFSKLTPSRLFHAANHGVSGSVLAIAAGYLETHALARVRMAAGLRGNIAEVHVQKHLDALRYSLKNEEISQEEYDARVADLIKEKEGMAGMGPQALVDYSKAQVVLVLTDDYMLLMLDPLLNVLHVSRVNPYEELDSFTPQSAEVLIRPERVYASDVGLILVKVQIAGPNMTTATLYSAFEGETLELRWRRVVADYDPETAPGAAGRAGDGAHLNFFDDALDRERSEEEPWEEFREAFISTLPHRYTHPWDAQLSASAFFRHKGQHREGSVGGRARARSPLYRSAGAFAPPGAREELGGSENYENNGRQPGAATPVGKDGGASLNVRSSAKDKKGRTSTIGAAATAVSSPSPARAVSSKDLPRANVLVSHTRDGVVALHLFTGKVLARLQPLKASADVLYHDIDDDFVIDEIGNYIGTRQSVYTRTMQLPEYEEHFIKYVGVAQELMCEGMITRGVPEGREPLYNATVCRTPGLFSGLSSIERFLHGDIASESGSVDSLSLLGSRSVVRDETVAASPVIVQQLLPRGSDVFALRRYAIFFVDSGLVTALDPVGRRVLWRSQTESEFAGLRGALAKVAARAHTGGDDGSVTDEGQSPYPHLVALPLLRDHVRVAAGHVRTLPEIVREEHPYILAIGEDHITAISSYTGVIECVLHLPEVPVAPSVVADFDGDGISDVILVGSTALYGYTVYVNSASGAIPTFFAVAAAVLGGLFFVKNTRERNEEEVTGNYLQSKSKEGGEAVGGIGIARPEERRMVGEAIASAAPFEFPAPVGYSERRDKAIKKNMD